MVPEKVILQDPQFKESRLESLYSNFNHLKENPEGLEANVAAWKSLLLDARNKCPDQFEDKVAFDSDSLVDQFSLPSKGLVPKGLNKVIDQLVQERVLVPFSQYQQDKGLLGRVVGWVFGPRYQSGNDSSGQLRKGERFIIISELSKWSLRLGSYLSNNSPLVKDHLVDLASKDLGLSRFDIECCLLCLERERKLAVEGDVVRVLDETQQEVQLSPEQVESIATLKYSIYKMTKYNDETEKRVHELEARVREYVKKNQMIRAKSELKIQKALSAKLQKSTQGLENLVLLLYKIEENNNNMLVVKTLESNSKILKNMNEQVGDIASVVQEVREEWDRLDQLSEHLGAFTADDSSIDEELELLEKEEKEKTEQEKEKSAEPEPVSEPHKEVGEPAAVDDAEADTVLLERFNRLKLPAKATEEKEPENPLPA
ncbi:hypothetical protein KL906_001509 [Ogataea polymorpha]|nr:uncharacterized protein OGAPODRAFT_93954 [Ogataea polymorpha]KAG7881849.1 hypothetical protein KL937_001472 [Ogataea polymorpha]KAG7894140.1 hypothetical protein KL908_002417 [Ogataea polymorpha]KAG7911129.1 hypothetical protein KL906_001509 [Ogataea polymorpha]KAG7918325.1 hypothetical protein KL927_001782 [Ogataea polymorpha]KAG7931642.1 hypothetical protein KL934_004054 [Ogataea polymorpha]